jgi:uncharacterized protein involved in exopolysaccharide biosynthesis
MSIDRELRIIDLLQVLFAQWRISLGFPIFFVTLAATVAIVSPRTYVAETSFVLESADASGGLPSGLASLAGGSLGLSLGGGQASPEFYSTLVYSRNILDTILRGPDPLRDTLGSVDLLAVLRAKGRSPEKREEDGLKRLRQAIATEIAPLAGTITINVSLRDPEVSAALANRIVAELERFDTDSRQHRARQKREFVEERVREASEQLTGAEDRLEVFLDSNRSFEESPRLRFQEDRLRRQINIAQEVYLSLRRQHDEARIEEVNDTPVFTIIDKAEIPLKPAYPVVLVLLLAGLFVGVFVGVPLALLRNTFVELESDADPALRRILSQWSMLKSSLGRSGR